MSSCIPVQPREIVRWCFPFRWAGHTLFRMELSDRVPDSMRRKFDGITAKTDAFCHQYLNEEYMQFVRLAVAALCRKRPSPLLQGSEDSWAAGVVHAIGTPFPSSESV